MESDFANAPSALNVSMDALLRISFLPFVFLMGDEPDAKLPKLLSMRHARGAAQLDLAQGERERNRRKRDQHQDPKGVHVSQEGGLQLDLLSDPDDGLL